MAAVAVAAVAGVAGAAGVAGVVAVAAAFERASAMPLASAYRGHKITQGARLLHSPYAPV